MSGDAQVRAEEVEEVLNCIHALLVKISAALSEIEQALSKAREQLARRREEIERLRCMLEEVPCVYNHEFIFLLMEGMVYFLSPLLADNLKCRARWRKAPR